MATFSPTISISSSYWRNKSFNQPAYSNELSSITSCSFIYVGFISEENSLKALEKLWGNYQMRKSACSLLTAVANNNIKLRDLLQGFGHLWVDREVQVYVLRVLSVCYKGMYCRNWRDLWSCLWCNMSSF